MRDKGWKGLLVESWALIAVAVIAFVGGLLIGDLGSSPQTETVYVAAPSSEGEEAEARKPKKKRAPKSGSPKRKAPTAAAPVPRSSSAADATPVTRWPPPDRPPKSGLT